MDTGPWKRLRTLFEQACDLPDGERTRFLEATRASDPQLADELVELVRRDREASEGALARGAPWSILDSDLELRGKELGAFKILHELGRGGMGQVWVAEQRSPKRLVALKTLRSVTSDRTRRRFAFESELLARLRHPGIATVYESGAFTDAAGETRPWFAMELVEDALPLGEYVRAKSLSPKKTIELFLQVCDAVQHGHQHGVIHRDLKPQNILVDPRGRVKVIDFGVARVVDDTERSFAATMDGQLLGTPDYMSPEQLERGAAEADTRSDVWALGVMLYELLTGQRPYELGNEPLTRAAQALAERRFERPSRFERSDGKPLARELDWILMRSIERAPERRYSSAGELAAELRRYLRRLPLLAGPPGFAYRARGFVRRHRVALSLASVFVIAIGITFFVQRRSLRLEREAGARQALALAHDKIRDFAEQRAETLSDEARVVALEGLMTRRHFEPDERVELDTKSQKTRVRRRSRAALGYEVLELLSRAERLDPTLEGIERARADMWIERWREARAYLAASGDQGPRVVQFRGELELARKFVVAHDREGRYAHELRQLGRVDLSWDPPDAELHLFRYVDLASFAASQERRRIPIAMRDEAPKFLADGGFALRVVTARAPIELHDVLLEVAGFPIRGTLLAASAGKVWRVRRAFGRAIGDIWEWREARLRHKAAPFEVELMDASGRERRISSEEWGASSFEVLAPRTLAERGGVSARWVRDGRVMTGKLGAGLELRTTAAPLFAGPASLVAHKSPFGAELEAGLWVAVLRKPGYEASRLVLRTQPTPRLEYHVPLQPIGTSPPSFVPVVRPRFWIQERELRCDEYLRFLNDPKTRAEVDRSKRPMRFPRYTHNENQGGFWPRNADGTWRLPDSWRADWPAVGVSFEDAKAYCAWYTEQEHAAGRRSYRYVLPSSMHWHCASQCASVYVFGDEFRASWVKSCFARPRPCIEAVMSYPIDESPLGIFDLSGSAFEWCDEWFWKARGMRAYRSGSWAMASPPLFSWSREQGATETAAWDTYGFRLVALPTGK